MNDVQAVLCSSCDCPRLASAAPVGLEDSLQPSTISGDPIALGCLSYMRHARVFVTWCVLCFGSPSLLRLLLFRLALGVAVQELYNAEPRQQRAVHSV